ncbi:MAG TPA: hypothetical protein PLV42_03420 [bacterium]|nr:hypothetical protein [bacterium]
MSTKTNFAKEVEENLWKTRQKLFFLLMFFWVAIWLILSRWYVLDDALIHLRYAENLFFTGKISYNGDATTFGSSSLLYVAILSGFSSFFAHTLFSPKLLSIVFYLALLIMISKTFIWNQRYPFLGWVLLVCFITPASIRWLTDGMETSLVILWTLSFSLVSLRLIPASFSFQTATIAFLSGFLTVFLRNDLSFLVAVSSLAIFASFLLSNDDIFSFRELKKSLGHPIVMVVGVVFAFIIIFLIFGQLLPDTAMAKSRLPSIIPLFSIAISLVAAGSFGVGLLLLWIATFLLAVRFEKKRGADDYKGRLAYIVLINLSFPMLVLLSMAKGMIVHGIRHYVWALVFSLFVNLLLLQRIEATIAIKRSGMLIVAIAFLATILLYDTPRQMVIFRTMSNLLYEYRNAPFERFNGRPAIASDIGYFGYFSKAKVCDLAGLVNGYEMARLHNKRERTLRCVQEPIEIVHLEKGRMADLQEISPAFGQYKLCKTILPGLDKLRTTFSSGFWEKMYPASITIHDIYIRPDLYEDLCPKGERNKL